MKLYRDYIKERNGWDLIETDDGFVAYRIEFTEGAPAVGYIQEAYVAPYAREKGVCREMMDQVCKMVKEAGGTVLFATICPYATGANDVLRMAMKYGFTLCNVDPVAKLVVLVKEV